jgi:predicted transcriptional regulator
LKIIEKRSPRDWLGRGVKCNEIVERMNLEGQTVAEHLKKLIVDGKVKRIGTGRYLLATTITLEDIISSSLNDLTYLYPIYNSSKWQQVPKN